MTGKISRENVLATAGNYAMYAANQDIWSASGECLVPPGVGVVYDPVKMKSLGAGITTTTNPNIVIGVGVDTNGDGVSETIRACFGDKLYGHYVTGASAEPPACGVTAIKDFFFECTEGDEFTIAVTIENNRSRREMPYNKDFTYVVSVKTDKTPCATCEDQVDCSIVSCKIVDVFEGKPLGSTSLFQRDKFTEQAIARYTELMPFDVVRLFGSSSTPLVKTSKVFCVSTVAGTCDNCIDTNFLFTTATFTDTRLETPATATITFTNVANTAGTATLSAQLARVVNQINTALDGNGRAVLRKNIGKCCPFAIEVNTCFDDFAITGLTPCSNTNPFADPEVTAIKCKNCTPGTTSKAKPKCGIRVIAKGEDYDCSIIPTGRIKLNFLSKIEIYPLEGFTEGSTLVKDVQVGSNPKNLGYYWEAIDLASDNGGLGRSHNPHNTAVGALGLPGPFDRSSASRYSNIKCAAQYCSYRITSLLPFRETNVHGTQRTTEGLTSIIVPSGDTVTRTSLEAILNPWLASSPYAKLATITCSSDQDQDGGTYPDYNADRRI